MCAIDKQNIKHFPTFVERLRGLCGASVVKVCVLSSINAIAVTALASHLLLRLMQEDIAYKEYVYNFDDKCPQYIHGTSIGWRASACNC